MIQTVILCGGKGTRIRELSEDIPKPLISIGDEPILWHIMDLYARQGFRDFILCLGHKGDAIIRYFREKHPHLDESEKNGTTILSFGEHGDFWHVTCLPTGEETPTGGRIKMAEPWIHGDRFFATYGDGLSSIDLEALQDRFSETGNIATLTAVQPYLPFGILSLDETGKVREFHEKPRIKDWINGGFFVFSKEIFNYLSEDTVLEQTPLETLAKEGQLNAYKHQGFWQCMDTFKDYLLLNEYAIQQQQPWLIGKKMK